MYFILLRYTSWSSYFNNFNLPFESLYSKCEVPVFHLCCSVKIIYVSKLQIFWLKAIFLKTIQELLKHFSVLFWRYHYRKRLSVSTLIPESKNGMLIKKDFIKLHIKYLLHRWNIYQIRPRCYVIHRVMWFICQPIKRGDGIIKTFPKSTVIRK